jgi:hypothetical protein
VPGIGLRRASLGSVITDCRSNEISAGRQLLGQQGLLGKIVLADALHSQDETAQQILDEQRAIFSSRSKSISRPSQPPSKTCLPCGSYHSPHPADTLGEGRSPSRAAGNPLAALSGSHPRPGGFPGARLAAR